MKATINTLLLLAVMAAPGWVLAQDKYKSVKSNILIEGTSTLHDWEMNSSAAQVLADFVADANGKLSAVNNLSVTIGATTLKSGKESMDNNAYKALNTKSYSAIRFTASAGSVTPMGGNKYQLKFNGNMTISSKTIPSVLVATCDYNPADGSYTCQGTQAIAMTQFGVTPPSFMMGSIKTGDKLTVKFNAVMKK